MKLSSDGQRKINAWKFGAYQINEARERLGVKKAPDGLATHEQLGGT
jgi:hypothetical protein